MIVTPEKIKTSFIPGDEWLYYKLYSGVRTSDRLLTELVNPFVKQLLSESIIKKWFFVRYADPENHIRLRLFCENNNKLAEIMKYFNQLSSPFLNHNQLWKVQIDTYIRETVRYGKKTIELAESWFFYDSEMIIKFIDYEEKQASENRLWMFALLAINRLLDDFGYSVLQKEKLLDALNESYKAEFNVDRKLKSQLDKKYRKFSGEIYQMIHDPDNYEFIAKESIKLLKTRSKYQSALAEKLLNYDKSNTLETDLNSLISSFIHMMINRFFRSRQRTHELVLYDFLSRFYKSERARRKSQDKSQK